MNWMTREFYKQPPKKLNCDNKIPDVQILKKIIYDIRNLQKINPSKIDEINQLNDLSKLQIILEYDNVLQIIINNIELLNE